MNLLEAVYCYLHHEKIKEGKPLSSDTTTGNMLVSLSIVMYIFGVFYLLIIIFPDLGDDILDFFEDIFGRGEGRLIGQLLMIVLLAIFFPMIKMTVGTPSNFERIKANFIKMSSKEQETTAQKGKIFFLVSVFLMVGSIFFKAMSTLF